MDSEKLKTKKYWPVIVGVKDSSTGQSCTSYSWTAKYV